MYYPKSQIKTNLYTNGNEYLLSTTNQSYIGYYYEVSNGTKYTGKTPQDPPNITLIPIKSLPENSLDPENPNPIIVTVDTFPNQTLPSERYIPVFNLTLPTSQDQQNGQFTRYFCKRNNNTQYLEISKETHDQLKSRNPQIAWDLYTPVSLIWQITGNKEQVYKSNRASAIAIEQNLKWYGFSQYFQDKFLKYYVES
jgi:hypothetical protein